MVIDQNKSLTTTKHLYNHAVRLGFTDFLVVSLCKTSPTQSSPHHNEYDCRTGVMVPLHGSSVDLTIAAYVINSRLLERDLSFD